MFSLALFNPTCQAHDNPHVTQQISAPIIDVETGPRGFIWLATSQALYRFDGSTLREVQFSNVLQPQDLPQLHCLTRRKNDALLIGSDKGIYQLPFASSALEASMRLSSEHLLDARIHQIAMPQSTPLLAVNKHTLLVEHQGELLPQPLQYDDEPIRNLHFVKPVGDWTWLGDGKQVYVWDGLGSNLFKLTIDNPVTEKLPPGQLVDIAETDHVLYLLYTDKLVRLDQRYRLIDETPLTNLGIADLPLQLNVMPSGELKLLTQAKLYELSLTPSGQFSATQTARTKHIKGPWSQHYVSGQFEILLNTKGYIEVLHAPPTSDNALWVSAEAAPSGQVNIDYAIASFDLEQPQMFEYRIEPLQTTWQKTFQPLQTLSLKNLEDGQYTLDVRAYLPEQDSWVSASQSFTVKANGFTAMHYLSVIIVLLALAILFIFLLLKRKARAYHKLTEAHTSLHQLLNGTQQQVWHWNLVNSEVERVHIWSHCPHFPLDGVRFGLGQSDQSNVHPDDIGELTAALEQVKSGHISHYQCTYRIKNGQQWLWVLERGELVAAETSGKPIKVQGTLSDISDIINSDERIDMLATSLTNISDGICIFDRFFRKREINTAYERITGYQREQVIGQAFALPHYDRDFTDQVKHTVLREGSWSGEVTDFKADGAELLLELTLDAVRNDSGEIKLIVASFSDITERRNTENELRRLSNTDSLTGLPNRSYFQVSHSNLVRKRVAHALLLFDLDDFKRINDSLGHEVGDELLCRVADRLAELGRRQDTLYRLGGDEFGILIEDNTDINVISTIAQQVNTEIAKAYRIKGHEIALGSSIGIVLYPHDAHTSQELLQKADTAMYHAKQRGGNCYQFFNASMNENAIQRLVLESQVRHAIRTHQVEVYYQPKMEIATGHISGIEALARIRDEYGQFISPAQFIPLCEETGLIIPLSEQVLRTACRDMRQLLTLQGAPRSVAINLSARQFTQSSLALFIEQVLQEEEMHPRHIEFEITEGMVMSDPERAIAMLENLADMGVQLALDDFGTGYSSLAYLKRFPMHTLKIDKEFVDDITFDERDRKMVESIIGMAHNLGLKVVAEGVEEKAQLDILEQLQCEYIQGFYFAKPMSAEALIEFITKQQPAYS